MLLIKSGVYKITNIINRKIYIGSSHNIKTRWRRHRSDLERNIHQNQYLQNAWNKYGNNNFIFEIVEYVDEDKLLEREQFYLDNLESYNNKIGYNIYVKAGSPIGTKLTREQIIIKRKIKPIYQIGKEGNIIKEWYGAREADKNGYDQSCVFNCCRRKRKTYKGFIWIYKHEYIKESFDVSWYLNNLSKPISILQYDKNNVFIKEWNSAYDAGKKLNIDISSITKCCKGKYKTAKGFIFKYK